MNLPTLAGLMLVSSITSPVFAKELYCLASEKVGTPDGPFSPYTDETIRQNKFAVVIRETEQFSQIGRCSFSKSDGRVTCDFYDVDFVERDANVGHAKYYNFASQFDVQVFADMSFLENNGRGGLAYGTCEEVE